MTLDGKTIKVLNVAPPDHRPPAYKDVELNEDDFVMMANGKRVSNVQDLQKIYDSLKVGEEFKLGIKRADEMRLVSVTKADPKDLPKLQMNIVQRGGDDDEGTFPAVGIVLKLKGKHIVIDEILPGENAVQQADVKAGDILVSMNGKYFTSLKDYNEAYDALSPGNEISWDLKRGDTTHKVTFPKPQPRMMMIRREGKK